VVDAKSKWIVLLLLSVVGLSAGLSAGAEQKAAEQKVVKHSRAVLIRMEGMVAPYMEAYLDRKLEQARQAAADLVIVEIDSPGGYLDASEQIAFKLRDLGWAATVAYVPEMALSGAAIASLGTDQIVMRSSARIGDAGPIYQDENFFFRHAEEKVRSDLVQVVRSLAEAKGRPAALAEAMVDMKTVVYEYTNAANGKVRYMTAKEVQSLHDAGQWQKGPPVEESNKGLFLTLSGRRAVELGLAKSLVDGRQDLKRLYGVENLQIIEPTAVDSVVWMLTRPWITGILILVGLVALYIELSAPGISFGGLIAGLCAVLFFWSQFLGGTAGWLEVLLFLAGAVFLAVEVFLLPGSVITGLTGGLLMAAGIILAMQSFVIPETTLQWEIFGSSLLILAASLSAFVAAGVFLTWYFGTVPIIGHMVLPPPDLSATQTTLASSDRRPIPGGLEIGQTGVAVSPLRPGGRVRFGDTFYDVLTEGDFVDQGTSVRVLRAQGPSIVVRPVES
jgi:membrane-bound serine protease (ClpP class)